MNTPPGSPANGDAYIVGSAPTGAWAGQAGKIAVWFSEIATTDTDTKVPAWEFYTLKEGWLAYVEQDDALMLYNGTAWTFDFKIAGIRNSRAPTQPAQAAPHLVPTAPL